MCIFSSFFFYDIEIKPVAEEDLSKSSQEEYIDFIVDLRPGLPPQTCR